MLVAYSTILKLPANMTGLTSLSARLVLDGVQIGGSITSTFTELGGGEYLFQTDAIPSSFTGVIQFYNGQTYLTSTTVAATTTDTSETKTAAEMVVLLRQALSTGAGVVSVNIDGTTITYNRQQALEELKFWQKEAAREAGQRPNVLQIKMG